jgi:hypothetical protein
MHLSTCQPLKLHLKPVLKPFENESEATPFEPNMLQTI